MTMNRLMTIGSILCLGLFIPISSHASKYANRKTIEWAPSPRGVSFRERRDAGMVRQRLEYTCAAAALATLINMTGTEPVNEQFVLEKMIERVSPERLQEVEREGFSVGDIVRAALAMGYTPTAVQLQKREAVVKVKGPVIAHLRSGGDAHFIVITGITGRKLYMADPKFGNRRIGIGRFLDRFTGTLLVLEQKKG